MRVRIPGRPRIFLVKYVTPLRASLLTAATVLGSLFGITTPARADTYRAYSCERVALQAHNGDYVAAEVAYSGNSAGMLRARTDGSIGPWEQFLLCDVADLRWNNTASALFSDLDGTNGWVSAEFGYASPYTGVLRARPNSNTIGDWEEFILVRQDCGSNCWALLNPSRNLWVSAELGYATTDWRYGMLRARAAQVGPWEKFNIVHLS
jgi:hypothetical protein